MVSVAVADLSLETSRVRFAVAVTFMTPARADTVPQVLPVLDELPIDQPLVEGVLVSLSELVRCQE